ncbi:hypothetical protein G3O08_20150, partial [Cryomorpha ignava]
MKRIVPLLIIFLLSGCWVKRDMMIYQSVNKGQLNKADYQIEFKIVKDYKLRAFPFVIIEKSGKQNSWLVRASFQTSQKELQLVSMNVTITNKNGEVLYERMNRKVDLIDFGDYRAKVFDFGTFEKEIATNLQDTLIAAYEINIQNNIATQSIV